MTDVGTPTLGEREKKKPKGERAAVPKQKPRLTAMGDSAKSEKRPVHSVSQRVCREMRCFS